MAVLWLDDVDADDIETVGGKGASLGELIDAGLPVPPGFVVTAGTYRDFIEESGIDTELFAVHSTQVTFSGTVERAVDGTEVGVVTVNFRLLDRQRFPGSGSRGEQPRPGGEGQG